MDYKGKNKKLNKSIIITFALQLVAIIVYYFLYEAQFTFNSFMRKLKNMATFSSGDDVNNLYKSISGDLFNHYYDSSAGQFFNSHTHNNHKCMIVTGIAIILLSIIFTLQFKDNGKKYRYYSYALVLSLFYALIIIISIYNAFIVQYKLNLPDEKIYIFGDEFNKEIKKKLSFMYRRKIYLIFCSIFTAIGIIIQLYLGYLKHKNYDASKKNRILLPLHDLNTKEKDLTTQEEKSTKL